MATAIPSSITLSRELLESIGIVGAKHCGDKFAANTETLDTAMLRPFSLSEVTKEGYLAVTHTKLPSKP